MQLNKIGKIIRICLVVVYPLLAIAIWFVPMFKEMPQFNKIAISTLLVLYAGIRLYRTIRQSGSEEA